MNTKRDWIIYPNSTYNLIHNLNCTDTIDGICTTGDTLNDCVKRCDDNKDCKAGYYIKKGDESICAPLRTSIYKNYDFVSRVRPQSAYPEFDNSDMSVFLDSDLVSDQTKYIFHRDMITLKHVQSGKMLNGVAGLLKFDDKGSQLSIRTAYDVTTHSSIYSPIIYGNSFFLSIPETALLSQTNYVKNTIEWDIVAGFIIGLNTFTAIPSENSAKKIGDKVELTDEFTLKTSTGDYIGVDDDVLVINERDKGDTFKFVSFMNGYKCDGKCSSAPIEYSDTRNRDCYGCKNNRDSVVYTQDQNKTDSWIKLLLFILIAVSIVIIYTSSKQISPSWFFLLQALPL